MIIEERKIKETNKNGQLKYETTFGVIAPMFENAYKNVIKNGNELLIRIGITKRFWDNGQLNWQLKYNEDGSLSNEKFTSFRKYGTAIVY